MKNTKTLLFFAILFLSQCQFKIDTTESLAHKVFESFKNRNFEYLEVAVLDETALYMMYEKLQSEQNGTKVDAKKMKEIAVQVKKLIRQSFDAMISKADEEKIVFDKCVFVKEQTQKIKAKTLQEAEIKIIFSDGKANHSIVFKAIELEGIWYLLEELRLE